MRLCSLVRPETPSPVLTALLNQVPHPRTMQRSDNASLVVGSSLATNQNGEVCSDLLSSNDAGEN